MILPALIHLSDTQQVLLACAAVLLIVLLCLRQSKTLTLSSNDKGELLISRHAMNRVIETCCEQLRGVASARANVKRSRKGEFSVVIRLKVRPNAKLDAIQGYLTQEVADIFKENLGIGQVGRIEVEVVGVTPEAATF